MSWQKGVRCEYLFEFRFSPFSFIRFFLPSLSIVCVRTLTLGTRDICSRRLVKVAQNDTKRNEKKIGNLNDDFEMKSSKKRFHFYEINQTENE